MKTRTFIGALLLATSLSTVQAHAWGGSTSQIPQSTTPPPYIPPPAATTTMPTLPYTGPVLGGSPSAPAMQPVPSASQVGPGINVPPGCTSTSVTVAISNGNTCETVTALNCGGTTTIIGAPQSGSGVYWCDLSGLNEPAVWGTSPLPPAVGGLPIYTAPSLVPTHLPPS